MKNALKRVLALAMALILGLGGLAVTASAADAEREKVVVDIPFYLNRVKSGGSYWKPEIYYYADDPSKTLMWSKDDFYSIYQMFISWDDNNKINEYLFDGNEEGVVESSLKNWGSEERKKSYFEAPIRIDVTDEYISAYTTIEPPYIQIVPESANKIQTNMLFFRESEYAPGIAELIDGVEIFYWSHDDNKILNWDAPSFIKTYIDKVDSNGGDWIFDNRNGDPLVTSIYDNWGMSYAFNKAQSVYIDPSEKYILAYYSKKMPKVDMNAKHSILAKKSSSEITVNGQRKYCDAYTINENNYFKLRDIAYVLNYTDKNFDIVWDEKNSAISITNGVKYNSVGGETRSVTYAVKTPVKSTAKVYIDGKEVALTVYNIDGNNYFKLRDLGQALDFDVTWDGVNNTIVIDTSKSYTPD